MPSMVEMKKSPFVMWIEKSPYIAWLTKSPSIQWASAVKPPVLVPAPYMGS